MVARSEVAIAEGSIQPGDHRSLRKLIVRGGSTLGLSVVIERGAGFVANIFAARAAGPGSFGAYSLVLATAGMIANYAGAGIGSTASRFSGQYPVSSKDYRGFLRSILIVSIGSALVAALLTLISAEWFAKSILGNQGLVTILRIGALSAGALILLECCKGFLIGQQRHHGLLLLSLVFGTAVLAILPVAAHFGAGAMIAGQGTATLLAVSACMLFARRLGLVPSSSITVKVGTAGVVVPKMLRFGMTQLGSVIGINIASWWLASLLARHDVSLFQMGLYAVANQFRGLAGIGPGLLAQICYPLLTPESGREYGGPDRVLLANSFLAITASFVLGAAGVLLLPFVLRLYGESFAAAEVPCALALATAVVHMGAAPAANRMSIVNLRATAAINLVASVLIVGLGIWFVPRAGATGAVGAFLLVHTFSSAAVLVTLKASGVLAKGLTSLSTIGIASAATLALFAFLRTTQTTHRLAVNGALAVSLLGFLLVLLHFGRKQGWLRPFPINLNVLSGRFHRNV